jgi:hypothetical protein
MPLTIIYEDADLIALNKPGGQATIPGRNLGDHISLVKELETYLKSRPFVVHRAGGKSVTLYEKLEICLCGPMRKLRVSNVLMF